MDNEKPLFIPLRTKWFIAFVTGEKDTEYRAYGARWNERTCRVGRPATIAHGYSGVGRLQREVAGFEKLPRNRAPFAAREIYPDAEFIAAIHLPAKNPDQQSVPPAVDFLEPGPVSSGLAKRARGDWD